MAEVSVSTPDQSMLATLARSSAVSIVERYAGDVRDRAGLVEAIARLALIGLEGNVALWEASGSANVWMVENF